MEAISPVLMDNVVWPKLKNALQLHSLLTVLAFLVWSLATGSPSRIASADFFARGLCIIGIQSICIAAVLVRRSALFTRKKRLEDFLFFALMSVLGALFVATLNLSASWSLFSPGPLYILLLQTRPMRHMLRPIIRKPKILELKERLKSNILAGSMVMSLLLALKFTVGSGLHIRDGFKLEGSVSMCLFLWLSGEDFLEANVNQGHRFNLSSMGRNSLPRALTSKNEVKQVLALADLCQLSEERGMGMCRRNELFEPEGVEPGTTWNMVATSCLEQIQNLIVLLGSCVAKDSHEVMHGMAPSRTKAQIKNVDNALDYVQVQFLKLSMSARSLAGLASASRLEDQTGVIRTGTPGLDSVLGTLLEALVSLDNLVREKESLRINSEGAYSSLSCRLSTCWGVQRDPIDDAASLYFVIRGCLAEMCNSFGRGYLMRELARVHPRHMTLRALQNGLLGVLDCNE